MASVKTVSTLHGLESSDSEDDLATGTNFPLILASFLEYLILISLYIFEILGGEISRSFPQSLNDLDSSSSDSQQPIRLSAKSANSTSDTMLITDNDLSKPKSIHVNKVADVQAELELDNSSSSENIAGSANSTDTPSRKPSRPRVRGISRPISSGSSKKSNLASTVRDRGAAVKKEGKAMTQNQRIAERRARVASKLKQQADPTKKAPTPRIEKKSRPGSTTSSARRRAEAAVAKTSKNPTPRTTPRPSESGGDDSQQNQVKRNTYIIYTSVCLFSVDVFIFSVFC